MEGGDDARQRGALRELRQGVFFANLMAGGGDVG